MNVVADTNTVISGLLWHGAPRQVLNLARDGQITLLTSAVLLLELADVLKRDKFAQRLRQANATPQELVLGYAALAHVIKPIEMQPVVRDDPDDDAVLACALAGGAEVIVSGDKHLLRLQRYQDIAIQTAAEFLSRSASSGTPRTA